MTMAQQDYRTRDLYLASFLKTSGVPFQKAVKVSNLVYFVFDNSKDIRPLKESYFRRTGQVSALDYAENLKLLKRLLYT